MSSTSKIYPGYLGALSIGGGSKIRCTDFNVNYSQDILFYNHIIGLLDNITDGTKLEGASPNIQRTFWRAGTRVVNGSFTFPLAETSYKAMFDLARNATYFDMAFLYYCNGVSRRFTSCRVNTFSFRSMAGDVATMTIDVMGIGIEEANSSFQNSSPEKLITWDLINVNAPEVTDPIQGIEVTINNNCIPIFTAGGNTIKNYELTPWVIRVGTQEISGIISAYTNGRPTSSIHTVTTPSNLVIKIKDTEYKCPIVYRPTNRAAATNAIIAQLPFVGVDKGFNTA
ncbi:MAG: phage tail tube protein [Methanomassiliicoccales archaeon]|jgi:hypothetical protein